MKKIYICGKLEKSANYINACIKAGIWVYCGTDYRIAKDADAMILPGGADINPKLYNEPLNGSVNIDDELDKQNYEAIKYFVEGKKPILGICRGLQVLNVYFGGSLVQNIDNHRKIDADTDQTHIVHASDKDIISLYGKDFVVNSAHHQIVDRLAGDFTVTMKSEEGYVEGMNHTSLPIYAVQWHPERVNTIDGSKIFNWFISLL